ncbi:hypothetical protein F511_28126 [Dorcoceras hygrometricum]|uniref:Uncharacterized protein n=1 Tax=Dorcoceras hygrometricum TaxID=472368 RepID=A0A2Z7B8H9_9LAMI|nr:hypothetical protein F511_28126 [Dorcoceras hygrometricum]
MAPSAPRTRAAAALRMKQIALDNQSRTIRRLRAQLATERRGLATMKKELEDTQIALEASHKVITGLTEIGLSMSNKIERMKAKKRQAKEIHVVCHQKFQAHMSVVQYTSKFISLGTYVPTIMADNTLKMHQYKKGLNSRIQSALGMAIFPVVLGARGENPNGVDPPVLPAMSTHKDTTAPFGVSNPSTRHQRKSQRKTQKCNAAVHECNACTGANISGYQISKNRYTKSICSSWFTTSVNRVKGYGSTPEASNYLNRTESGCPKCT